MGGNACTGQAVASNTSKHARQAGAEMSLTRMVQVSTLGTHLLSVPQEVVGKMSGKPLRATWSWSRRESAWVVNLKERETV